MHKEINQELLADFLKDLQLTMKLSRLAYKRGFGLYEDGQCSLMKSGINEFEYQVEDDYNDFTTKIFFSEKKVEHTCSCASQAVCAHVFAAALQTQQELNRNFRADLAGSIIYSREGMIARVLDERKEKSVSEKYQIDFADNIHGEHHLLAASGSSYLLSFYDFDKRLGYCSCPDYQTNKLETCKHLMFAFDYFAATHNLEHLPAQAYPFIEIFRHPLKNYQIAWFFPHSPDLAVQQILDEFFDADQVYLPHKLNELHIFLEKIQRFKLIKIRPEVKKYIAEYFGNKSLKDFFARLVVREGLLNSRLFKYQREAAMFIGARKGVILADEIGLGKTATAINAALLKIEYSGFSKVQILCPDHLISHWEKELELWVTEAYKECFRIESFDEIGITSGIDFLIIDEAQKIDDYESGLVKKLNRLKYNHILLITDSTLESSLIKYYTMASLINQHLLTPLWELSYKHCLYDSSDADRIIGYHHLELVKERMEDVYLRRSRNEVANQLPKADIIKIPVALTKELKQEQSYIAERVLQYARKDYLNQFEILQLRTGLQQLFRLSQFTRTVEISEQTPPKMKEFIHFINHKLSLKDDEKVVIFVSSTAIQNQLLRALQMEKKVAVVWQSPEQEGQYFLVSEQMQTHLPRASHFIYYHLPLAAEMLVERMKHETEFGEGIHQKRFYLLCASPGMESWLFEWSKSKPHFLKQLVRFMGDAPGNAELSLRLKEELVYELKNLTENRMAITEKSYQISMFDNNQESEASEAEMPYGEKSNVAFQSFIRAFADGFKKFNELSPAQRQAFLSGQFEVAERNGELIVRFSK
jgi:hypothetical protein